MEEKMKEKKQSEQKEQSEQPEQKEQSEQPEQKEQKEQSEQPEQSMTDVFNALMEKYESKIRGVEERLNAAIKDRDEIIKQLLNGGAADEKMSAFEKVNERRKNKKIW